MKTMEKEFKLIIRVDPSVINKYPNYKHSFTTVKSFMDFIIANIDKGSLSKFGYKVKIEEL